MEHVFQERKRLAEELFTPAHDVSFARMVDDMTKLCFLVEDRKARTSGDVQQRSSADVSPLFSADLSAEVLPERLSSLQAQPATLNQMSVSEGDNGAIQTPASSIQQSPVTIPRSKRPSIQPREPSVKIATGVTKRQSTCLFCASKPGRQQHFSRKDALRRHHRFTHFQYQVGAFVCPVVACDKLIHDPDQFASHAVSVHKTDLGTRASIMHVKEGKVKPGKLITFCP